MKVLNWSWVAGFFQAEGYISLPGAYKSVQICQKSREPLDAIRSFWLAEFEGISLPKVGGPYVSKVYELYTGAETLNILVRLYTLLRGNKRQRAHDWLDTLLLDSLKGFLSSTKPIDIDWVTGFWEGDGSIINNSGYPHLVFAQKDVSVLTEIQEFLEEGSMHSTGDVSGTFQLKISIGKKLYSGKIAQLLQGVRTSARLEQITRVFGEAQLTKEFLRVHN